MEMSGDVIEEKNSAESRDCVQMLTLWDSDPGKGYTPTEWGNLPFSGCRAFKACLSPNRWCLAPIRLTGSSGYSVYWLRQ